MTELAVLPKYFGYWGIAIGLERLARCTVKPSIEGLRQELAQFINAAALLKSEFSDADFLVFAPDYASYSAGNVCLYKLAEDIASHGKSVAIVGSHKAPPNFQLPMISTRSAKHLARRGAWVVYPEIIYGNPINAVNIIRWVLNKPGLLGGDTTYHGSEHVFVYSDVYSPYVSNPIVGKLTKPTLDRTIFYPPPHDHPRSIKCFYVGKSTFKAGYFDTEDTVEITRHAPSKKELGKLFRSTKVLYCFDNSTALIYEALICGCPVVVIPDGSHRLADYEKLELGLEGISWGAEEEIKVDFDRSILERKLDALEKEYAQQLQKLFEYTKCHRTKR